MSWFRRKPADINVTDLLSRKEYYDDFVAAQQDADAKLKQNPLLLQLSSCSDVQARLMECAQQSGSSDPKCFLLHKSFMICAGSEIAPSLSKVFLACAKRNPNRPEMCDK